MKKSLGSVALAAALACIAAGGADAVSTNLLANGSFDDKEDVLKDWIYRYDWPGVTQWYGQNHTHVSVVSDSGRASVLKLNVATQFLADNPGVQVDGKPVPFEYGSRYELSLEARAAGPNLRAYLIGYGWKPGIKPHPDPELTELRMLYKSKLVYFGGAEGGTFGNPSSKMQEGRRLFPADDLSAAAVSHLKKIKFISVHICAVGGSAGDVFVDNVRLVKLAVLPGKEYKVTKQTGDD